MSEVTADLCALCEVLAGHEEVSPGFWAKHHYRLTRVEILAHVAHVVSALPSASEGDVPEPLVVDEGAVSLVRAVLPQLRRGIRLAAAAHDRQALATIRQDLQEAIDEALGEARADDV